MTNLSNILGKLSSITDMGTDAMLTALAALIDGLGQGTEWTGSQVEHLGRLEQRLADLARSARDAYEPGAAGGDDTAQ